MVSLGWKKGCDLLVEDTALLKKDFWFCFWGGLPRCAGEVRNGIVVVFRLEVVVGPVVRRLRTAGGTTMSVGI